MMSVIEQTRDDKIAMYLKLTKRELAEMLVNANEALAMTLERSVSLPGTTTSPPCTMWLAPLPNRTPGDSMVAWEIIDWYGSEKDAGYLSGY